MYQMNSVPVRRFFNVLLVLGLLFAMAGVGRASAAEPVVDYEFATPLFGLAVAPDGSLLVADAGAGIVELRNGEGSLVQALPGVSDVAPIGRGSMFAVTGGGDPSVPGVATLYRVSRDEGAVALADLAAYETAVNPAGGPVESNPLDVAVLNGGKALVADAAGNSLLVVDNEGNVDWVATLPNEEVSTNHIKHLAGCPNPIPGAEFVCFLPPTMPAEPVATSVAIGPDGAYYVGELKGFPAPTGESRVWRIEPGVTHVQCGVDPECTVVLDGFTSIVDLAFGPDGTLYVVEFDENAWLGAEIGAVAGGTVNACDVTTGSCSVFAGGLLLPFAVAVDRDGQVYAVVENLFPTAKVVTLP